MTLIAVFLALGLGLLLGGTLGDEVIVKEQVELLQQLEDRYTQTKADNSKLQKQTADLTSKSERLEEVMAQVSDHYVRDRLPGKKVAILQLEPADLSALLTGLKEAGTDVISTVLVTNSNLLLDVKEDAGLSERLGLPQGADLKTRQQALADALVRDMYQKGSGATALYLKDNNALTVNGTLGERPDHVILVGGGGALSKERMQRVDLPLLRALSTQEIHIACVEHSQVEHSGVAMYREMGVSTVDNIDQVAGMVALVDILGGAKGHYGIKKTAEALLPQAAAAKEVSAQ